MAAIQTFKYKRLFLNSLVVSVAFIAVLSIVAVLSDNWGQTQTRILLTLAVVSAASICGLACGAYLATTPNNHPLPAAGIGLALVAGALLIGQIWGEGLSEEYFKVTGALCVLAVASAHLCLLSLARLADRFRWSLGVACTVILVVAGLIILLIFREPSADSESMMRLLAVAAIIDAAMTVLVPVFHWLSRTQVTAGQGSSLEAIDREIATLQARLEELRIQRAAVAGMIEAEGPLAVPARQSIVTVPRPDR